MAKKQKNAYWLLSITALLLAGAVMSVGESQARYVNTAAWYTVAKPVSSIVSSDCLEQVSQPPMTVLLGQMDAQPPEITFTLKSIAALYASGFSLNVIQALCTFAVLFLLGKPLLDKLDRIKQKYGIAED